MSAIILGLTPDRSTALSISILFWWIISKNYAKDETAMHKELEHA